MGQQRAPKGFFETMRTYIRRAIMQTHHELGVFLFECFQRFSVGGVVGTMMEQMQLSSMSVTLLMYSMALGLMTSLACLRTFGSERVVFWREAAPGAGMNLDPLAYFIAKILVDLPRIIILTICVCV